MKKNLLFVLALTVVLSLVVACSSPAPTPIPPVPASPKSSEAPKATEAPKPTNTAVPPTVVPPTAVPPTAVPPTAIPPTAVPPTALPPTAAPASSASSAASSAPAVSTKPGLYVADLRIQPTTPTFNQNISFFVTFNNTDTKPFTANWKLFVYRADIVTKSDNETTVVNTIFAPGKSEVAALGTYKYGATGRTCEYFFVRVVLMDSNNQPKEFTTVDGKVFEKGFQICDVGTIATSTPSPAQPTSTIVAPGAGLFVTGMRLDPAQPGHNQNINFYPTFNNTTSAVQNFAWKVYVYNAASPANPALDTAPVQGSFAAGSSSEGKAGTPYYWGTTGNQCDYFFARVGWQDGDKRNFFTSPDGKTFEKGFSICN